MIAGVFPGQGIEPVVILAALPEEHDLLTEADEILGFDLRRRVEQVARRAHPLLPTDLAQPAIFVAGMIGFHEFTRRGERPDFLVGHSLGEYTALVAAGSIPYAQGVKLVAARARAMKRAACVQDGGMAAVIGLPPSDVRSICAAVGITFANDNSPAQAVVSGARPALTTVARMVSERGGKTVLLPVEGAYHSEAMTPAEDELIDALARTEVHSPAIPVLSNVTAAPYRAPGEIRKLLGLQLTSTVRFRESIAWLSAQGVTEFVDLGPGRIVGRLARASALSTEEVA